MQESFGVLRLAITGLIVTPASAAESEFAPPLRHRPAFDTASATPPSFRAMRLPSQPAR